MSCVSSTWLDCGKINHNNELSALFLNIRSIKNKFAEFISHLSLLEYRPTFLILCETWLSAANDYGFEISGYDSKAIYRNGRGGGIKIYYIAGLNVQVLEDLSGVHELYESLFIRCCIPRVGNVTIGGIYRPPHKSVPNFLVVITQCLNRIGNHRVIMGGDFNINYLSGDSPLVADYNDLFSSFGFYNNINLQTYISTVAGNDLSCLDHIWSNLSEDSVSYTQYIRPLCDFFCIQ